MVKSGEFNPQKRKNIGGNPEIYGRANRKISEKTPKFIGKHNKNIGGKPEI